MGIIDDNSLALTLDALNESFFMEKPLSVPEKRQAAKWLAGRQGKPGSYAGMFAPTRYDFDNGVRLFTGEKIPSRAATGNILGQETCRALLKMNVSDNEVQEALTSATRGMMERLNERLSPSAGYY